MTPSSLIIVTDRGGLKAYRVDETPTRGPSLQLVQAFNITDAHGRLLDKVTDQAGRFPVSDGAGMHHAASIAERTQLDTETDRRIYKQLADQITKIVNWRPIFDRFSRFNYFDVGCWMLDPGSRVWHHGIKELASALPGRWMF